MKKKKKLLIVIGAVVSVLFLGLVVVIVKNKCFSLQYEQLNSTDKKMLAEYNQLYEQIETKELWTDFNLADKPVLAVSRDNLNTYLINPKEFQGNLFAQQIDLPEEFKIQSVYRVAPIVPQVLKIRLHIGSNFNTIGKKYPVFGNEVYYVKYDNKKSFEMKNTSAHFAPFLAHESFHYYMQNQWKMEGKPETELSNEDMKLLEEQYRILDEIKAELQSEKNHEKLISYAKQYVEVVSKRMENNREYVSAELIHETAEGTAQYLTIKTSKMVGYDYGTMYFDNVTNVPMADIIRQVEAGNFSTHYLYDQMPYQTGAELCILFDELNIPDWQKTLNSQTLEHPINLYDILKDYVSNL